MKHSFHIAWSEEDGAYVATCLSFPALSAFGDTPEGALRKILEVMVVPELFGEDFEGANEAAPVVTVIIPTPDAVPETSTSHPDALDFSWNPDAPLSKKAASWQDQHFVRGDGTDTL